MMHGEKIIKLTNRDCFITACDSEYFKEYGISFFMSCYKNDMPVHITVMNPDVQSKKIITEIKNIEWDHFSYDFEYFENLSNHNILKNFYACGRIRSTYRLIKKHINLNTGYDKGFFMMDVDSIIRKKFTFPDNSLYFYLRDDEAHPGMKILASGMVRCSAAPYLLEVLRHISSTNYSNWFSDQIALNLFLKGEWRNKTLDMAEDNVIDWEFKDNSYILYPKGDRKFDTRYLLPKRELEEEFNFLHV